MDTMKPWMMIAPQILGALPLAVYPFMLLDIVRSLIGYKSPKEYHPLGRLFFWSIIFYPVVFAACVTLAWSASDERLAGLWSAAPLVYLASMAVCLITWLRNIFKC